MASSTAASPVYVAFVLLFLMSSSLLSIFINKLCLTSYNFRFPLTILLSQMLFAATCLSLLHLFRIHTLPSFSLTRLRTVLLPALLFTTNVVIGLSALSLVSIPMFSVFRRLTLLFVMAAEYVLLGKKHSVAVTRCVIIMAIAAFVSAVDDVTYSNLGYLLVFLNNFFTAAYLVSIKRIMDDSFNPLTLQYYTAIIAIPLLSTIIILTGEVQRVSLAFSAHPDLRSYPFFVALMLTSTGAFAVNYSTTLCTHVTSPLTTSVTGQVKNVLQTVIGCFTWGFVPTPLNMAGLVVAMLSQVYFTKLKIDEQNAANNVSSCSSTSSSTTTTTTSGSKTTTTDSKEMDEVEKEKLLLQTSPKLADGVAKSESRHTA